MHINLYYFPWLAVNVTSSFPTLKMNIFTAVNVRLTSLLLASFVILAPAMYFDLGEQEEKCLIEEIPEDTLVTGQ